MNRHSLVLTFFFQRFKRRKLLKAHMRIHTQYPTIECEICGKRFRRNIQRDNHIKERHGAPIPKREKKPPPKPKARKCNRSDLIFVEQDIIFVDCMIQLQRFENSLVNCVA